MVQGTITTSTYEKDEKKIYDTLVTANTIEFIGYQKQIGDDNSTDINADGEIISKDVGMPPLSDEELPF